MIFIFKKQEESKLIKHVKMLKKWTGLIECLSATLRLKESILVKNIVIYQCNKYSDSLSNFCKILKYFI
jgi:hypothetical protein